MTCPACGKDNPVGAKFCAECGGRLVLACPACGTPASPGAKFCHECGNPLAAGGATAPAAAPAAPPSAEVRQVSVLFVDLEGFTTLSESRDAEDVRELLGQYFDAARRVIDRYGGTVEKYIGDAVMAVWGSPVAREDDGERAVRAALDVVDAVAGLAETVAIPTLRARAGVVTGQAASWGSGGEALVVGDRVNTAARIQGLAEPGTVLVDDATRLSSLASIAYVDAGLHAVKGREEPVHVWRAQRVVAGASGNDRVDGLEARFVGRDSELRLVKDMFHSSAERPQSRLALVVGAPGAGKSRLLSEFSRYTDGLATDTYWHVGRCLSYGEGVAFWALAEAVRQRLGIPEDAQDAQAEDLLDAGLRKYVHDAAEAAYLRPRLAALLGLPGGEGFDRQDLMAGWRTFLQRLAEDHPVVLVIEDMQWADTALLDFVDHLLEWAAASPIFVLGLARPELLERRPDWVAGRRNRTVLWLDRLPDAAIADLLDDLVPGIPDPVRGRIVAQAEGVPLYAVESIRALVDRGLVQPSGGRYVLTGEVSDLEVPPSLTSLLASRLDGLGPDERSVAMRMSVFRGGFSREAVVAVADLPDDTIDAALAGLVRREVLTVRSDRLSPDRGQYAFAQALLRQVAYDMLGKRERRARHIAAAEHLTQTYAAGADVGEVLASHYRGAYDAVPDDPDAPALRRLAHHAYISAGERGLTVGSPDAAERSFAMAATLTEGEERVGALLRAADAAFVAGRNDRALEYLGTITADPAATDQQWAEATLASARAHLLDGRLQDGLEWAMQVIDRFPDPTAEQIPVVVRALSTAVNARMSRGDDVSDPDLLDRALRLAEDAGDPELVAACLAVRASQMTLVDRPMEAIVFLEGALRHTTDPRSLQTIRNNLGDHALQADSPEASEHFEAALDIARRRGDRQAEAMAVLNLAELDFLHGQWDRAEARARETLSTLVEFGYPADSQVVLRLALGLLARFRGDAAALHTEHAASIAAAGSDDPWNAGLHAWLGTALRALDGADVCDELADQAAASLSLGMRTEWFRFTWVDALGEARAWGRWDLVERLQGMVTGRPQGSVPPFVRAQLLRYQGLALAQAGDHRSGIEMVGRAASALRSMRYPYWTACAELDLAALRHAAGDDSAAELEAAALEVMRSLGAGHVLAGAAGATRPAEHALGGPA